jgi:hypothetical protein
MATVCPTILATNHQAWRTMGATRLLQKVGAGGTANPPL